MDEDTIDYYREQISTATRAHLIRDIAVYMSQSHNQIPLSIGCPLLERARSLRYKRYHLAAVYSEIRSGIITALEAG